MSNTIEDMNLDLRVDDLADAAQKGDTKPANSFVKAPIKVDAAEIPGLTPEQILAFSKIAEDAARKHVSAAKFDATKSAQMLPKKEVPILDYSKLTLDDVYDLTVPIEAIEFMSADGLKISLKDSNYEPRWVNKNPQNIGDKMGKGFTYIEPNDLVESRDTESISTSLDGEGHYSIHDVVAMKIPKSIYLKALRAAHLRAMATTDQAGARKRAATASNDFMQRESGTGNDFVQANSEGKMKFYDPGIEV